MGIQGFEELESGFCFADWLCGLPGKHDAKVMGYGGKDSDNVAVLYVS
jgi:hypothetical protein